MTNILERIEAFFRSRIPARIYRTLQWQGQRSILPPFVHMMTRIAVLVAFIVLLYLVCYFQDMEFSFESLLSLNVLGITMTLLMCCWSLGVLGQIALSVFTRASIMYRTYFVWTLRVIFAAFIAALYYSSWVNQSWSEFCYSLMAMFLLMFFEKNALADMPTIPLRSTFSYLRARFMR